MHGRLKVKSTAEQLEAKRKEREKKLLLYNGATSKIFSKRKNNELDEEMLYLTGEVLAVNPDFYTLWNIRKETFLEFEKLKSSEEFQKMLESELFFLENCLKINPKSYGTWHHRCFVMDHMPKPDWNRELNLCATFFKFDGRNFHCWDYRRFIVKRAGVELADELTFSLNQISSNFSNFSSWHYRSKLLPVLFADKTQPMGVSEDAMLKEHELVQNGFFTDPDDQSNWIYHRWLIGRGEPNQAIECVVASRKDKRVVVSLAQHTQVPTASEIVLELNGSKVEGVNWKNQENSEFYSTMWIASNVAFPNGEPCKVTVSLLIGGVVVCSAQLCLDSEQDVANFSKTSSGSRFSEELSAVKTETLQESLDSILELMELETDNKWVVLTAVRLMKAIDPVKYEEEIMKNVDKLEALDLKRVKYYRDLRSRFIVEYAIDSGKSQSSSSLTISGRALTKLHHTELLPLITSLDLSTNQLSDLQQFNFMQSLRDLDLSNNRVENCHGLRHTPQLERLILKNNQISSPESLCAIQTCPSLRFVDISGNPVCDSDTSIESIKEMLPGVEIVFQDS